MAEYLNDSFFNYLDNIQNKINTINLPLTDTLIESTLDKNEFSISDLEILLSITEKKHLDSLINKAGNIKHTRFGNNINLYSPLYVSNFCNNSCAYCGYSSKNKKNRIILTKEQLLQEANYLRGKGITHILLVSGEDSSKTDKNYFIEAIKYLSDVFNYLAIEIQPLDISDYRSLYETGLDGVTVYQETYNKDLYRDYHPAGAKMDYRYRIETPARAARADIPNITIGALLGLAPYRDEILYLAYHLDYLIKKYWRINFAVSFPRIIEECIDFKVPDKISDFELVKIIASIRLVFPETPIYLSTRESPYMRDNLIQYGVTHISVESKTGPGGYTLFPDTPNQFNTVDKRSLEEILRVLKQNNIRPVFKDWDKSSRYPNFSSCK